MLDPECIKSLYKLAETCPEVEFQHRAFKIIQQKIHFDSASWAESTSTVGPLEILRTCVYKDKSELMQDDHSVPHLNPATFKSIRNSLQTFCTNLDNHAHSIDPHLLAWGKKYNIQNLLQTNVLHDNELFISSIALGRSRSSAEFTESERLNKQSITPHLVESFRLCRRFNTHRCLISRWKINHGFAMCNHQGLLFDADDAFIEILKTDYPQWKDACLPNELISAIRDNLHHKFKQAFYRGTLIGDMYLIVGRLLEQLQELSDREFQIAYDYSMGYSYKDIAFNLSIAPATVRNHISNIYGKLNINNKSMLIKMFE